MSITNLFELLCGMAMFMFGMALMGDGLKKAAGNQLEKFLAKLTDTPLKGILLGTGVTAVIQSSSATSVMTVGFVNSGMMKFRQSIGIILGSIVGTSVTGWIIALSSIHGAGGWTDLLSTTTITGVIAVIGLYCRSFSKRQKNLGDILLGFVVLMVGIETMSGAMAPLSESKAFVEILTMFSNPILGILAGTVFTAVLQSASAAVGILQALTATGAIDFDTAFPILLGISIGAAVPVLLSALAANTAGKRTAFVYLIASVLGVIVCGGGLYIINIFADLPFMTKTMTSFSIAEVNTLFRVINIIVLFPFIGLLEKLTCFLIKDRKRPEKKELVQIQLEERFLPYPSLAISQSKNAVYDMAKTTVNSVKSCFSALEDYKDEYLEETSLCEQLADRYENDIGTYLMKLSRRELNKWQNADVFKYLHTLSDFERITDHAMSIAYIAKNNKEDNIVYSEKAGRDLGQIKNAVNEILDLTVEAFMQEKWQADDRVAALNTVIRALCNRAEMHHVRRLQAGECTLRQGSDFGELLTNLERMAVHCGKIVMAMIEVNADSYRIHIENGDPISIKGSDMEKTVREYSLKYGLKTDSAVNI
ncbi:MAG: Na/Pi cotransporter family protein [Ruminococcus sp.]|nr:Na/Pi cotransporter family protein [Ruminococcus sp.]